MATKDTNETAQKVTKPMRTIKLIKTKELKDDLVVCLNGKTYQIQRGVEVKIPEPVAKIIDNSERMDALALERSEAASKMFA